MKHEIDALLSLGRELLSVEPTEETFVERVTNYSAGLSALLESVDTGEGEVSRGSLQALLELHREIITRCQGERSGALVQLKELEQRGKAIRSYLDTLPRRISRGRVKLG